VLLLGCEFARCVLELLHPHLHARKAAFKSADVLLQRAPLLVERRHILRHGFQLFEARLEIRAVGTNGLHLVIEQLEYLAVMVAEGALARGAVALVAERNEFFALLLEVAVLEAQRIAPRLRFLSVAHPLCAAELELSLGLFERAPPGLQLHRDLLFEGGSRLHPGALLTKLFELRTQHAFLFHECLAPSVMRGEVSCPPKLVANVVERNELNGERQKGLPRRRHELELRRDAFQIALQAGHLGLGHAKVAFEML
jgi:hypothetical protein